MPSDGLSDYYKHQENDSDHFLGEAVKLANNLGAQNPSPVLVRAEKSIVEEIIEKAEHEKEVDLIVIGTRGLGGFKKMLLGSVSSGVITHSHCNTLVVR